MRTILLIAAISLIATAASASVRHAKIQSQSTFISGNSTACNVNPGNGLALANSVHSTIPGIIDQHEIIVGNSNQKVTTMPVKQAKPEADSLAPPELIAGMNKAKNGDFRGAIKDYNKCIKQNNKNYNAYYLKGKALYLLHVSDSALFDFNQAIKYNQKIPECFYYRGCVYYQKGLNDKAFNDFNTAVKLKPGFTDALNYRGVTRAILGHHAEAIADYNKAIKLKPGFAAAYFNKGTSEAALGKYTEAIASFTQSLELDTRNVSNYMNRGNCYVMIEDYDKAIGDFSKAIEIEPKYSPAYINRGAAFNAKGNTKSCDDWRKAEELGNKKGTELLNQYCK